MVVAIAVSGRHLMFDLIMSFNFKMLRFMVNDFFLAHWLLLDDFLLMENRLVVLSRLIEMSTIMTFVVERLMSSGLMVDRFTINSFMVRDLGMGHAYIVIEDGQVRFLSFMQLRNTSHVVMILN